MILNIILPFYTEITFLFLIGICTYNYLFKINPKLNNDNFPLEELAIFILISIIFIIYFLFKDPEVLFFSNRLILIEYNIIIIKLFLLLQFFILCIL